MYSMSSLTSCGVCEANSSIMFYGSSSGASMSLPSKSRLKRQSRTFTQVCVHEHTHTLPSWSKLFQSQETILVK